MKSRLSTTMVLFATLSSVAAFAQSSEQSTDRILGFEVQGIHALMKPEAARQVLLDDGYSEKGEGEDWGKVPTASFTKDNTTVAITHYEGVIYGLSEVRLSAGEELDYSGLLQRIRQHFGLAVDDQACVERDYGTRCGFRDGDPKGARFIASLTTQMISVQFGKRGP
ncbi:MAG: hypothetical protein QNJ07_04875 [Woeseiaceae bacterium]|nr:hypothetical protein [Woeseiaceae bacterium]